MKLPRVTVGLPRCPACKNARHSVRKTVTLDCGAVQRTVTCDRCAIKFLIVAEDDPDLRVTSWPDDSETDISLDS